MAGVMKLLMPLGTALAMFSLASCNTAIGVWRDTKEGAIWTKNKIQEKRQASQESSQDSSYGAPVY